MTTDLVTADVSRHLGWMTGGHRFFMAALAQVSDDQLSAPSALPGWTGRHILSHVGYNAAPSAVWRTGLRLECRR